MSPRPDQAMDVIAVLVERGGPEAVEESDLSRLFNALGLTGVEVRSRGLGRPVWRSGEGRRGSPEVVNGLTVIPLGGSPSWIPGWRLLLALIGLFLSNSGVVPELPVEAAGMVGNSRAMKDLQLELGTFAPTDITVLLKGETGAGKEVAARALHRMSGRTGRFVPVNIAAMPGNLLEAELFGSERGAFTGADRSRRGLVDRAEGGTLFLDEVGDLEPRVQVHLLRFLETKEVRPLGSDRFHRVNVRIVVATNVDLGRLVARAGFRQDLYYRLAAVQIDVPPLRERREDIPVLKSHFQSEIEARHGLRPCRWSPEAESILVAYSWPGNVRELRHAVEVATVRAAGRVVAPSHLPIRAQAPIAEGKWHVAVAELRRRMLSAALRRNRGNRSAAARELGISRQSLLYHLRNLGLGDDLH